MADGTIFDRQGKKATRHRVLGSTCLTQCGVNLLGVLPTQWSERARWGQEPKRGQDEQRCRKCYPKFRR